MSLVLCRLRIAFTAYPLAVGYSSDRGGLAIALSPTTYPLAVGYGGD